VVTDQQAIATTILTALNAITGVDAYDLDEIPVTAGPYVVIRLYNDEDVNHRGGGDGQPRLFLETIYRGPSVQNCRELRRLVQARFRSALVGTYALRFNQEQQPIDDDPDWKWSGTDAWSFI
jgi:hypothetical protein